jgi:hypothetical protein
MGGHQQSFMIIVLCTCLLSHIEVLTNKNPFLLFAFLQSRDEYPYVHHTLDLLSFLDQ